MTTANPESNAGRKWPFFIVGLLLLNVTVCAITVTAAVMNPADTEPNYYQRALDWDRNKLEWPQADSLGWKAIIGQLPGGLLDVRLEGPQGPVLATRVEVEVFHQAHSRERVRLEMKRIGDGRFVAPYPIANDGSHEIRLWIDTGTTRATTMLRETLAKE